MNTTTLLSTPVPADGLPASPSLHALAPADASPLGTLPMASITPFAAQVCRCRQAAADTYTLVRTAAQSSANAAQSTAVTVAAAERLDWIGNAATMFRQRLRELNARAGLFADRAQSTLLECSAGAP